MEINSIITFLTCIILIFIFGKIFIWPIKSVLKLMFNSIFGGILIYIINLIGANFNFHIGLNFLTSLIVGFLGIPGAILLIILKIILRIKPLLNSNQEGGVNYSTVTDLARFLGLSTSKPLNLAI